MKVLITHLHPPRIGGSYMYTKELIDIIKIENEYVAINGHEITSNFNNEISSLDEIRKIDFDLIIIMQAGFFKNLNIQIKNSKIINVIHSEIYDADDPIIHNRAEYIAVREEIKQNLIHKFNIHPDKIHVLINPINKNFYENISEKKLNIFEKSNYGLFACSYLSNERLKAAINFALFCKELNCKSLLVSNMDFQVRLQMQKIFDYILDATHDVNSYMKNAKISGGILKGRTYWEAKLCGKQVIEYMVDLHGNILDEIIESAPTLDEIEKIKKITDPNYLWKRLIEISKINEKYNITDYFDMIYFLNDDHNLMYTFEINQIKIKFKQNNDLIEKKDFIELTNYLDFLTDARKNKFEQILIIKEESVTEPNINYRFQDLYDIFEKDWEILILSDDYSSIAMREKVYLNLLNNIDFKNNLKFYIANLVSQYKTYYLKN